MTRAILGRMFLWAAVAALLVGGCVFTLRHQEQQRAEDEAKKAHQAAQEQQLARDAVGRRVKSWTLLNRSEILVEFEDGTAVRLVSVAHHGAGSHLELHPHSPK